MQGWELALEHLSRARGQTMRTYILVGIGSGILFGVMDRIINANPLA
jgi:hypothetical protein